MGDIQGSPRFEKVKDLGSGNFGLARLERELATGELVAIKYLRRGSGIDDNVAREIVCHRLLRHRNVVMFKEVLLTPTHLAIVMEYASGGEVFERICSQGRFGEPEARFFFRQLLAGVAYCHAQSVAHRDLKLENALLDGCGAQPVLKICDFGYSKSSLLHSAAKSTVGTPAYIAPEVLARRAYDGRAADVWSCGVTLYVMLVGTYPFEDPAEPRNFRATIGRILARNYSFPQGLSLSAEVLDLFERVFVVDPQSRLTVAGILAHPWLNMGEGVVSAEALTEGVPEPEGMQSVEDIARLVQQAQTAPLGEHVTGGEPGGMPMGSGAADCEFAADDIYDAADEDADFAV